MQEVNTCRGSCSRCKGLLLMVVVCGVEHKPVGIAGCANMHSVLCCIDRQTVAMLDPC